MAKNTASGKSPGIKIFVSYSHADREQVLAIEKIVSTNLQEKKIAFFIDWGGAKKGREESVVEVNRLHAGEEWKNQIFRQILECEVFIYIVSSNSLESKEVRKEVNCAIAKKRLIDAQHWMQRDFIILPVFLENKDVLGESFSKQYPYQINRLQSITPRNCDATTAEQERKIEKIAIELAKEISSCKFDLNDRAKVRGYLDGRAKAPAENFLMLDSLIDGMRRQHSGDIKTLSYADFKQSLQEGRMMSGQEVTVTGMFYPTVLFSVGWWDPRALRGEGQKVDKQRVIGRMNNDLQKWLFEGFDAWAPSWDYTSERRKDHSDSEESVMIGQLGGEGDEADSTPVIVPWKQWEALKKNEMSGWGGLPVEVRAQLINWEDFWAEKDSREPTSMSGKNGRPGEEKTQPNGAFTHVLRIYPKDERHGIIKKGHNNTFYSGYLWKCVIPSNGETEINADTADIKDAFFIWEHANWANQDSIKFARKVIDFKEREIIKNFKKKGVSKCILLKKSCSLLDGEELPDFNFHNFYHGRNFVL